MLWAIICSAINVFKKTLKISSQRLTRQRNIRRKSAQNPIIKKEVNDKKLTAYVVMPEGVNAAFSKRWPTLSDDHTVDVRVPMNLMACQVKRPIIPKQKLKMLC